MLWVFSVKWARIIVYSAFYSFVYSFNEHVLFMLGAIKAWKQKDEYIPRQLSDEGTSDLGGSSVCGEKRDE